MQEECKESDRRGTGYPYVARMTRAIAVAVAARITRAGKMREEDKERSHAGHADCVDIVTRSRDAGETSLGDGAASTPALKQVRSLSRTPRPKCHPRGRSQPTGLETCVDYRFSWP